MGLVVAPASPAGPSLRALHPPSPSDAAAARSPRRPASDGGAPAAARSGFARAANAAAAAAAQLAAPLLWLPQAALVGFAIGEIAAGGGLAAVWPAAAIVLALGVVRAGFEAAAGRLAFGAARAALSERRAAAAAALAARSPLDIDRPASGLAASVIAEQAEALVPHLARFRPARLRATAMPVAIFLAILPFSWVAALVLLVAAPLIPIFMALIGWRARAAAEAQLAGVGGINAFLLDRLRGLATIRSLDAVDVTARRLRASAESLRARTMAVLRIAFLSSAVLELFAALGVAMVAVYVGFHLLGQLSFGAWGGRLGLGEGMFILLVAPAFFEPLRELSAVWHDRAAGEAAAAALARLAEDGVALPGADGDVGGRPDRAEIAAGDAEPASTCPPLAVTIEGLTFRHAGAESAVLDGFGLAVAAGEHVALLGPSGVGKSTLVALVAGLAPVGGGRIAIGGTPLTAANAAELRARMAWIGQRPHIFAGKLADNVSLGRSDVGREAVATAMRVAALDEVARGRGEAPIGEGGAGLSGGEALRLALARAAASRGAGLVLADEPTAHLDRATADEVVERLLAFAAGRTLIVATHDPALAARMDRVVRLDAATAAAAAAPVMAS